MGPRNYLPFVRAYTLSAPEESWILTSRNIQIYGPALQEVSTPSTLNGSMKLFYDTVFKQEGIFKDALVTFQDSWVDVSDVAIAHVRALEVPAAGGERFIISAGPYIWQDWRESSKLGIRTG